MTKQTGQKLSRKLRPLADTFAVQMAASTGILGPSLKRAREEAHLTQVVAAERLNVALRTLQNWEHGSARPRWESIEKLARIYGVEVEGFLRGEDGEPRPASVGDRLGAIEDGIERLEKKLDAVLGLFTDAEALVAAIDRRRTSPQLSDEDVKGLAPDPTKAADAIRGSARTRA